MVIAPCSIKTAAAIAACYTDTLITRAADVTLKEGRPLIMLVRETPLHLGHLRVLTALAEMGAVVLPPMPAFYNRPKRSTTSSTTRVARVLDRLQLPQTLVREWRGDPARRAAPRPARVARCLMTSPSSSPVYNEEENLPHLWSGAARGAGAAGAGLRGGVRRRRQPRPQRRDHPRVSRDADQRVRLVRLKANAGETAATDAGFKAARGRWVVTMDADLQNDPHDIPRCSRTSTAGTPSPAGA